MKISKKLLFFPALAVGVIGLVVAINLKPDLPTKPAGDRARLVETLSLEQQLIAPLAVGFGKVVPKVEWKAIAEVTGQIVYRHPDLDKGQVIPAGTVVLKVDPLDYELKLIQAEADLKSSQTSLAKLNQEEDNLNQTLKIEKNRLVISNKELQRKQDLRKKGLTSQSDVDLQQQSALSQQKLVLDIANQITLMPDEKRVAEAVIKVNVSKVKEAQRSLDKTTITLPRAMRIAQVDIEQNQVVNLQQEMFVAHGINIMEVEAQLSIHDMQTLASSFTQFPRDAAGIPTPDQAPIKASVQLNSGSLNLSWPAKVARISETVDENQATAGIILEIAQDYSQLQPSNATPLVNGMFVKAEIEGVANLSWVLPERALHGDKIYLMDDNSRLKMVNVEVLYRRDNQVVVNGELQTGDKLVLNDLLPAIEGMLLKESGSKEVALEPDTQESAS
ncbi:MULTISPECIES: efflux RND transporter periplasmic adaptor subunit [Vibrio]|uniref:Acriflavin resistance protein n=3 Tax=Vibrio cyclitrophicus TaxID=47951 RepID=A0A7Z1MMQ7_9VIBR|nr:MULTISPECIES: acriflavin resistance protein [Vibrio]KNH12561.1 acriflavin resistance protein [Vibrio lentus]MBY7661298.1 HlyD family secretion protein [Vibrio atlanticus]ERM59611.1 Membrane fusion protein of RND family multidrug efflux pump [Vibrio cyclitrophicus FF75]KAA8599844.1 RND efflux system membrane fusion protein [Vibrio cyclitrophicus]MBE8555583.1 HlyD family secretion protein [Vibrio sp. OPT24]|tara:strand:+ start:985 stop:2322 length:1338 start_codon:yes stop_codon:yes gene_type:complete